jgi:hypothetical protein
VAWFHRLLLDFTSPDVMFFTVMSLVLMYSLLVGVVVELNRWVRCIHRHIVSLLFLGGVVYHVFAPQPAHCAHLRIPV